jgi:hypothetical protein
VLLGSFGARPAAAKFLFDHQEEIMVICPASRRYLQPVSAPHQLFNADAVIAKILARLEGRNEGAGGLMAEAVRRCLSELTGSREGAIEGRGSGQPITREEAETLHRGVTGETDLIPAWLKMVNARLLEVGSQDIDECWFKLSMGRPSPLHSYVQATETPAAFCGRVSRTYDIILQRGPGVRQLLSSKPMVSVFLEGIPPALAATAKAASDKVPIAQEGRRLAVAGARAQQEYDVQHLERQNPVSLGANYRPVEPPATKEGKRQEKGKEAHVRPLQTVVEETPRWKGYPQRRGPSAPYPQDPVGANQAFVEDQAPEEQALFTDGVKPTNKELQHQQLYNAGGSGPGRGGGRGGRGDRVQAKQAYAPLDACYNCGETGHIAAHCRSPPKCHRCGQRGHVSRDCPAGGGQAAHVTAEGEHPWERYEANVTFLQEDHDLQPCG